MDILSSNKKMASGGRGVIIHVIDTGCELVGELRGVKIVPFRGEAIGSGSSGALVLGAKPRINYAPTRPHGTMMCSVAHRQAPGAEIWSYNAIPTETEGYVNDALAYILNVAKTDTAYRHIVTMSLAGEAENIESAAGRMHYLIQQLVALNVMVVVAAGNDGGQRMNKYPSYFAEPVTVSALNNDGTLAGFSTWHNEVDFAELGRGVPCIDMDGRETVCDGTSPATQDVGAKMACMWSKDLTLTEPQLYEAAKTNAQDLGAAGRDPMMGWGWIASVDASTPAPEPKPEPDPVEPPTGCKLAAAQLVAYYQRAVKEGWGYVWSLNGDLYTREMAEQFHVAKRATSEWRDPATYWLTDCARWIGKMAADCSGGIVGAIRTVDPSYIDRRANLFYAQCTEKGPISTIPEIPGLCVWRDGHIGIYEGGGYVLEFRGTEYGAVRTKLAERNFTNWGKLRDVKYENEEENELTKVITKNLAYDADVQALQAALNALGYDCGAPDGKAGDKTMAGIAAFCATHGAAVVMPETLTLAAEICGTRYVINMKANG